MVSDYDDGRIILDDSSITIRWYYPWGSKQIAYRDIRAVTPFELSPVRGRWRLWGSGDLVHWYNLDRDRPRKTSGIELDLGGHIRPCITPDDSETVAGLLAERLRR